jgi:hypothetical protein
VFSCSSSSSSCLCFAVLRVQCLSVLIIRVDVQAVQGQARDRRGHHDGREARLDGGGESHLAVAEVMHLCRPSNFTRYQASVFTPEFQSVRARASDGRT